MTLRQRLAGRSEFIAALFALAEAELEQLQAEFEQVNAPEFDSAPAEPIVFEMTFAVRSKAEADEVINAYIGARPLWRNGYYMAEWTPPPPPPSFLAKTFRWLSPDLVPFEAEILPDAALFELHFAPAITVDLDVSMGCAGGAR